MAIPAFRIMVTFILGDVLPSKNACVCISNKHISPSIFDIECQSSSGQTTTALHADNSTHTMEVSASTPVLLDDGVTSDANLGAFLSRKIKIASYIWAVGAPLAQNFDPWNLFLSNAAVQNKLQNFFLLKANLKVSFYVNGTPFHAGMLLASYSYLHASNETVVIGGDLQLVTRSQRPHIYLNVSTNKSGCLCVPFFVPQNFLALSSKVLDSALIGRINLDSFSDLTQLSGGVDSVTITVFAEMMDVKLAAPTTTAVALAGDCDVDFESLFKIECQSDEYTSDGPISSVASNIASAAGKLTSVPIIGTLAMATQIGASAIGGVASLFGYSKPVQLSNVMPMRNTPVSSLALTEGSDTSQKLTVTGKQEITVDPSTVGLPSIDELSLDSFTQRESYVTQFVWGAADLVDSTIFSCDVSPMNEVYTASTGGTKITPTSLSFASRPFQAWSGKLRYRFQVIGTQFHRGRLAIIYDPVGPMGANPYNTTFNTIIDLSEGRDFTVEFAWQNDSPYLNVNDDTTKTYFTTKPAEGRIPDRVSSNGAFYVNVINELVTPDASLGITILVTVSAGDDFELINPRASGLETYSFVPIVQSGISDVSFSMFDIETQSSSAVEVVPEEENSPERESTPIEIITGMTSHRNQKSSVFYGERILSFRQLLKRYSFVRYHASLKTTGVITKDVYHMKQMPLLPGFDTLGSDTTLGADAYTYNAPTYINYLRFAFAGWRGGVRWKFLPTAPTSCLEVHRFSSNAGRVLASNNRPVLSQAISSVNKSLSAWEGMTQTGGSTGGAALTQNRTMDALEVEIPYALPTRFSHCFGRFNTVNTNTLALGYPGGDEFTLIVWGTPDSIHNDFKSYCAVADDFTYFGFVGAPTIYAHNVPQGV